MRCSECGQKLERIARRCPRCGVSLDDGQPVPDTVPAGQLAPTLKELSATDPPIEPDDHRVGVTVADRFLILRRLGAGGMGTVYLAEQTAVKRPVVLKFLHAALFSDPAMIERFHREALAASQLVCPNTIVLHDFGQTDSGRQYMAMEYLEGVSLSEVIASSGALPPLRAIGIVLQILASLQEAHAKGIVHRDLKPDNIMLVSRAGTPDFVKVLDFGIAKLMDPGEAPQIRPKTTDTPARTDLTQQGAICGSPGYMAPEQILGRSVDHRADLYAVGVILYQMLGGKRPFEGDSLPELMRSAVDGEVPPLNTIRPELTLPESLERLILHCLSRDPDDRPESADGLAEKLRSLTPAIARQQQEQERALLELVGIRRRWTRHLKWMVGGAVAILLCVIWLVLYSDMAPEGKNLAPGQRIFVSASAAVVPEWVEDRYEGRTRGGVRSISSKARALRLARAQAVARRADVPPRFHPTREREQYNRDLEQVAHRVAEVTLMARIQIDTFWARFAMGTAGGGKTGVYDAYARVRPLTPDLSEQLREAFAELRYDRYSFLTDEATRRRQCERALGLADKVTEAITHLPKKKEQKRRLEFILKMRLAPCLRRDS